MVIRYARLLHSVRKGSGPLTICALMVAPAAVRAAGRTALCVLEIGFRDLALGTWGQQHPAAGALDAGMAYSEDIYRGVFSSADKYVI